MTMVLKEKSDLDVLEIRVRTQAGFSASTLVMQEIVDVSNEIPQDINALSSAMAQHLASRFLHALNLCGDLMAISHRYEMRMETKSKEEYSRACLIRAAEAGYTKIGDKKVYADMDSLYLEAKDASEDAKSFRIMVVNKHKALEKAHYHMRKIGEADGNILNTNIEDGSEEDEWK